MRKKIILLLVLFSVIFAMFYALTKKYSDQLVSLVLREDLKVIQSHHRNIYFSYKSTSTAISKYTITLGNITDILSKANNATKKEKEKLRNQLMKTLQEYYNIINKKGVFQYQFVLANGESFYKFHNPTSFGEDVSKIREDFKYSIENKSVVSGFSKGSFSHGFRNIFPIFDENKKCIGAMEIAFSSEKFQKHLNNISEILSHFLIPNDMLSEGDYQFNRYKTSYENNNYKYLSSENHHKTYIFNGYNIIKDMVQKKIKENKPFSMHYTSNGDIRVISFIPIKNMKNEAVAWVASNKPNFIIGQLEKNVTIVRALVMLILILISYFLIRQISVKTKLTKQKKILSNVLDATKSIMFITDFKNISFSNKKFDDLVDKKHTKNILTIFQKKDGFLHEGLLEKDENFMFLVKRTLRKNCLVSIIDKNNKAQSYAISISRAEDEYLVTLSNVTELQKHLEDTQEKAYIDSLTKVFNRNKFTEVFKISVQHSERTNSPLSLALVDIDKFKLFNDTYGHLIGDEVLVSMAQTVQKSIRGTDFFARWGGEEFVIIFQYTGIEDTIKISNKIREKIQANNHKVAGQITASFGVAQYKTGDTLEDILKRCDNALYKAKHNGRNRVEKSD